MDAGQSSQWPIQVGYIMLAKPKYFEPRPEGSGKTGQHPVVVLTRPNHEGKVKVASMSHSHPDNPPQRPTSTYNLPFDPIKGEGTISVGEPRIIDFRMLKYTNPVMVMSAPDFAALMAEIRRNCPDM